ncbi:DUF1801 domain-containing protein [Gaetbulibacter aestuarii]
MNTSIKTVDAYIQMQPDTLQPVLENIRKTILEHAPEAIESISYGMPVYKLNKKPLVYFGAFKKHIGFFATPKTHEAFQSRLSSYKQGKGSVQFPINKPIPYALITDMVKFRLNSVK